MATVQVGREAKRIKIDNDILEVMPIGAGSEVGRSCVLVKFKGKTVMFDCGVHPAHTGFKSLPFFDEIDPEAVDLLLISHFHLDHCAALPYFLSKTNFKGRIFMTHPTKAIYRLVLSDSTKVSSTSQEVLYDDEDVVKSMERIEAINYHQELNVDGITFCSFNAGHVLGAAMFLIDIAGVKVLYTGDFSREEDRHLMAAEIPPTKIDLLICESTYGVQMHEPREQREKRFCSIIYNTIRRGGRVLIPAFALGRSQELLLILEQFWEEHRELHNIPIYYASSLAKKCMTVFQTFINMMNMNMRQRFAISNPFIFQYISALTRLQEFEDSGPCVVMASPGMLQGGVSRELFEMWCTDPRNAVLIPGYCVEGTLAKTVMSEPREIETLSGGTTPLRMTVHYLSFSAHSDYVGTSEFIDILKPQHVVLVHGEANEMSRLAKALADKKGEWLKVHTPKNCETAEMVFRGDKIVKAVGSIAQNEPAAGDSISGVLVKKDFSYTVLAPEDIPKHTHLSTNTITQRLLAPCSASFETLEQHLRLMFDSVEKSSTLDGQSKTLIVHSIVAVTERPDESRVCLEWSGSPYNDMIADIVIVVITNVQILSDGEEKAHPWTDKDVLHTLLTDQKRFLSQHYTDIKMDEANGLLNFVVDDNDVTIDVTKPKGQRVICTDEELKEHVSRLDDVMSTALRPIPPDTVVHNHSVPLTHENWIDVLKPPGTHICS